MNNWSWSTLGTWAGAIASGAVGYFVWLVTKEQANISKTQLDDALRPRIFRTDYISWDKLTSSPQIQFNVKRNEALKVSGYIVVDKFKYSLKFSLREGRKEDPDTGVIKTFYRPLDSSFDDLSWISADEFFLGMFDIKKHEKSNEENNIKIFFEDIEGNKYEFTEDKNYSQKQRKV